MEKKFKKLAWIIVTVMLVLSTMFIPVSAAEPSEREVKAALSKPEMPVISKLTNSYNAIVLKWNPVRDAKGYLVYRQTDSGSWKRVKTTSAVYYKDTAVKAGYQYTYIVKAYKTYKGKIIYSSYDKKGKSGKLTTAVSVSSPGAGTAALNWKKTAGASGYYIYRSSGKNGKYSKIKTISGGNTVSYENTGLQEGVYYYKVVPYGRINGKNVMSISSAAKGITVTGANIKLNKTELRLEEGKTYTLKVVGTSAKAVWKSGNDRTASVSSSGKVKGMKAGTAVITASVNGKSYKCTVVVEHIYSEATCTQPKCCQYCGKKKEQLWDMTA